MSLSRRTLLHVTASGALLTGCGDAPGHGPAGAAPDAAPDAAPHASASATARGGAAPPLPPGLPAQIEHGPRRPAAGRPHLPRPGRPGPGRAACWPTAEQAGARLTVLAVGTWLDAYPQVARRVLDGGHELGNHTQTHGASARWARPQAGRRSRTAPSGCERLTGSRGRWFRPSQARLTTPLVVRLARQAGYPHLLSYGVDPLDYTDPGPAAVRAAVARQAGPGSVVSLHFGHPGTVAALPGILDDLHRRGLRAVTTSELLT